MTSVIQHQFFPEGGAGFVDMVNLDGYVSLDASGDIVTDGTRLPAGVTVAHTTTGVYTFTFSTGFPAVFIHPTFKANAAAALFPQVGAQTATTVVVRLVNGSGSATNPSAACGLDILFRIKRSGV